VVAVLGVVVDVVDMAEHQELDVDHSVEDLAAAVEVAAAAMVGAKNLH
jgi:hypothetical protein